MASCRSPIQPSGTDESHEQPDVVARHGNAVRAGCEECRRVHAACRQHVDSQSILHGKRWAIRRRSRLSCQKSFVLLATDGNPTSDMNGNMYPLSSQVNTYNAGSQTWSFSQAVNDVLPQIQSLRTHVGGQCLAHDIQTYVVGLGRHRRESRLGRHAQPVRGKTGGTNVAYLANDASSLSSAFQSIAVDIESKTAAASAVSLNTGSWGTGTNLYQARFNSGDWSGQLISYAINQDGTLGNQLWDAGQVDQRPELGHRTRHPHVQAVGVARRPGRAIPLADQLPDHAGLDRDRSAAGGFAQCRFGRQHGRIRSRSA